MDCVSTFDSCVSLTTIIGLDAMKFGSGIYGRQRTNQ